jgi:hypothetical protein
VAFIAHQGEHDGALVMNGFSLNMSEILTLIVELCLQVQTFTILLVDVLRKKLSYIIINHNKIIIIHFNT